MAKPIKPRKKAINPKTGKHPGGRPTKFNAEVKAKAEKMSKLGMPDKEVAEMLDINERTITRWKLKHNGFCPSLKLWRNVADGKVERSLYQRARGYDCAETKAQWVQAADGGRWETLDMVKHYPPDPASMIFWLKNRRPDKWRDKQEHELTGKNGGPIEQIVNSPPPFKTIEEWESWKKKNENQEK